MSEVARNMVADLLQENVRLRDLLNEVAQSGVAFEDERLRYVEAQIDRETWLALVREFGGEVDGDA